MSPPTRGSLAWLALLLAVFVAILGFVVYSGLRAVTRHEPVKTAASPDAALPPPTAAANSRAPTPPPIGESSVEGLPLEDPRSGAPQTPQAAFADLRAALERSDAPAAARYLLAAKRAQMRSVDEALGELTPLDAQEVRITRTSQRGGRAVLLAQAESRDITSADGTPADIDVVVQMLREGGEWRVFRQLWLVNTPPAKYQQEAMAWLAGAPAEP